MGIKTNTGETVEELSRRRQVVLVFLRHFGCMFCRETMTRLANEKAEIERRGMDLILVHMVDEEVADQILELYELSDIRHISDPNQEVYRHFGLSKASAFHLIHPVNMWRTFYYGVLRGHFFGKAVSDPSQMPGLFLMSQGRIIKAHKYRLVSDQPSFLEFVGG